MDRVLSRPESSLCLPHPSGRYSLASPSSLDRSRAQAQNGRSEALSDDLSEFQAGIVSLYARDSSKHLTSSHRVGSPERYSQDRSSDPFIDPGTLAMETLPASTSITLACPSCGETNLESWDQKVVVYPDHDDTHDGNPLKTRGEWIAITLSCSSCNRNCFIATGNHKGQQEIGIFPGTPVWPHHVVQVTSPEGVVIL